MTAPMLSIVVLTRGPTLTVARFLRSLGRARGINRAELLIGVNGGGGEGFISSMAARYVGSAQTEIVSLEHGVPGEARNRLTARARGDVLLFLDDDVEVSEELLVRTEEAFGDPTVVAAGGPNLTPPAAPPFEQLVGKVLASPLGSGPVRHRYTHSLQRSGSERTLTLCNLAVRRSAFEVSGFDAALACAEENELLDRLERAGGRFVYRPDLVVFHHRRGSLWRHFRQMVKYGFGRGQLVVRHPSVRQLLYLLPAAAAIALAAVGALAGPTVLGALVVGYLALVAAAALAEGRRAPIMFALFLTTHAGYAAGTLAGMAREGALRLRPGSRDERLVHDSAKTLVSLLVAVLAGTATGVVVARALGPQGRGTFELGRTIAWVVAVPAGFGFGRAAAFFRLRGELAADRLHAAVLTAFVGGAVGAAVAGWALVATASRHDLSVSEIVLVAASIPLMALYLQAQFALRGLDRPAWYRRSLAVRDVLLLVFVAVAVAVGRSTLAVICAWTLHWLVSVIAIEALLLRVCGPPRLPRGMARRLVRYGTPYTMVAVLAQSHLRLDVVVVQAVDGASAVGQYAVAFGTVTLLSSGGLAVSSALFPRTAVANAEVEGGGAARTSAALRVSVAASIVAAGGLFFAAPALVHFAFGAAFAPSVGPLRVLLPGAVAMTAMLVLQGDLTARGRVWFVAGVYAGSVIVNLGLNLLLVPRLGATGAAVASSVTYTLAAGGLVYGFLRATGCRLTSCVVPRRQDLRLMIPARNPEGLSASGAHV